MSDIFLVLAQTDDGLSCFLLPRILPDGEPQRLSHPAPEGQARQPLQRLLGDRAARRLGADGRRARPRRADDHRDGRPHAPGLRDRRRRRACASAVVNATHHAAHRSAFGKTLIDQPLMRNVLADLCLESEASTALAMRLARAYDEAARRRRRRRGRSSDAQLFKRAGDGGRQVLDVQARPEPRVRGAGVPRRQRLRRGVGDAAPVPRGAARLDLGGLGQRDEPRRAARADALSALARGLPRTRSSRPRAPTRGWTRACRS